MVSGYFMRQHSARMGDKMLSDFCISEVQQTHLIAIVPSDRMLSDLVFLKCNTVHLIAVTFSRMHFYLGTAILETAGLGGQVLGLGS